jgi:hypothetical protein
MWRLESVEAKEIWCARGRALLTVTIQGIVNAA